ncbi:hypothetical protein [Halorussus marinus]|uniref:hypothetical protein n=1 Tax=Halorussus marinus TaxID=2505976 RepID=UPI00106EA1AD|nr:hypothetical protein [Halorussus marinus]
MAPSDGLTEERVREIVRDEVIDTSRSLVATALWTGLSVVALLVGLQLFQLALYALSPLAIAGYVLGGALVTGSSLYLLYVLYRT